MLNLLYMYVVKKKRINLKLSKFMNAQCLNSKAICQISRLKHCNRIRKDYHAASCKMKEALNTKRNPRDEDNYNFTLNLSAVNMGLTRIKIMPLWQNIVSQFL